MPHLHPHTPACGWKVLDLALFILNKSVSRAHLIKATLAIFSRRGLLDVSTGACALLSFQLRPASSEAFWTASNARQPWQAGRPLITVNYPSGREAPETKRSNAAAHASEIGGKWGRMFALCYFFFHLVFFLRSTPVELLPSLSWCDILPFRRTSCSRERQSSTLGIIQRAEPCAFKSVKRQARAKELLGDFNEAKAI